METELIRRARQYAEETFALPSFTKFIYHNLEHTRDVVNAVEIVGKQSDLTEQELESAQLAAWFHDVGYINGGENHEEKAAQIAKENLTNWGAPPKTILEVTEAILATRMPQQPVSLISKVVCDADLYHLASDMCKEKGEKLREETKLVSGKEMTDTQWISNTLDFMKQHHFHTPYGKNILEKEKKKNIKVLKKLLRPEDQVRKVDDLHDELIKVQNKLEKAKGLKTNRGIETMFRTTSHNHIMLSEMADNKANILITINSIILSVVVSVLIRKVEEDPRLLIPTVLLVSVCLATMVFAILATRPNVLQGRFNKDDIKKKRTNLLFFGNFHEMDIENYEWAMKEMMKDGDYLYGSMIKDIYYLGKVLGKKYKYLRISYNIFMFGFIVAIAAFVYFQS